MQIKILLCMMLSMSLVSIYPMEQERPMEEAQTLDVEPSELAMLLYLNMGKVGVGFRYFNVRGMKSDAPSPWYNRVYAKPSTNTDEVNFVKTEMQNTPFAWWVNESNEEIIKVLEQNGFSSIIPSEPIMSANLNDNLCKEYREFVKAEETNQKKRVRLVATEDDLTEWIKISAQGFDILVATQTTFIQWIFNNSNTSNLMFTIVDFIDDNGNYIPASTSLVIKHPTQGILSLHLVSTISKYRKNGLGKAASILPLLQAKTSGNYHTAILFASPMAHTFYKNIGFEDVTNYLIFTLNQSYSYCNIV